MELITVSDTPSCSLCCFICSSLCSLLFTSSKDPSDSLTHCSSSSALMSQTPPVLLVVCAYATISVCLPRSNVLKNIEKLMNVDTDRGSAVLSGGGGGGGEGLRGRVPLEHYCLDVFSGGETR